MKITKPKRGGRPTKRLDLTHIREALKDSRQWTAIGVVAKPEDGGPHYEIVGDNADVMVEVVIMPEHVRLQARLAGGMWIVPDVGDEVAVIIPSGELDFMPVITCVLAHAVPTTQGPAPQRIVIARGAGSEVHIHDGAGGAQALCNATYRSHEDTLIQALRTAMIAINTYAVAIKAVADPSNAATPALTTAVTTTFQSAITAFNAASSSYLTTVLKAK